MATDHVIAKITADISDLKAELVKGNKEFKKFGDKLEKAIPEDPFKRIRRSAASLISIAAVAKPFQMAGQAATQFEAEVRSLNTITDMSEQNLAQYADGLRTLSLELGTTTGAAANARAAYDVASAGFVDAADNAAVLETTLKAASAGGVEAADAAKLVSGSLKAYGASAQESEKFANVFFATVKNGITTFPELTQSLGNVTGIAAQSGISIEELGAAMATATSRGVKTSSAVDGLRGAVANLLAPSKQAKDEMARLGIVVDENTLKQDGLLKTLQKIREANGGSAESFKKILGDVQAFSVALALTSDGGELFAKNLGDMEAAAGSLDAALSEKSKSMQHSIDQFKVALEAAGVAVGDVFLPPAKAMLDMVTDVTKAFATAPEPVRDLITVVAALGGAYIAASKGLQIILSKKQLDTLATFANTAANTANTTVTVANTKALFVGIGARVKSTASTVANTAAKAASTVATGAATLATQKFTVSVAAANGVMVTSTAILGGLLAAVGALMYGFHELTNQLNSNAEAMTEDLNKASKSLVKLDDAFDSAASSAKKLFESGKTSEDLEGEIAAVHRAFEDTREAVEKGNLSTEAAQKRYEALTKTFGKLRQQKKELAELEKVEAERKKAEAQSPAGAAKTDDKADKEAEKARKEALKERLHEIKVLREAKEISADQEVELLEGVLQEYKTNADERRSIEERIASLVGDKQAEAQKKALEAQKEAKEAAKTNLDLRIKNLETEKEMAGSIGERLRLEKAIIQLEQEAALASAENAENKRQIVQNAEAQLRLAEQQAQAERDKAKEKKDKDDEKEAKEKTDQEVELLELKKEGLEIDLKAADSEKEKLKVKEQIIQLEGKIKSLQADDDEDRAQIEKNVQAELKLAREEAAEAEKKRHEEAVKGLEKEKAKVEELKASMRGDVQSLEEMAESMNANFGESTLGGGKTEDKKASPSNSSQKGIPGLSGGDEGDLRTTTVPEREGADQGSPGANLLVELATMLNTTLKSILQELQGGGSSNKSQTASNINSGPVNSMQTPFEYTTNAF